MPNARNRPRILNGAIDLRGSYRLACSTGAVTTIAAATATAGQLLVFRWPDSSSARCVLRYVGAKFVLTTAYTTAQETGIDMILARSFTVNATNGTAVDVGSTVGNTGKLVTEFKTSLITAGCVRVATASAITAGTHTLDANPISLRSDWTGVVGATIPASSGAASGYASLFDARGPNDTPLVFTQDEGFVLRNTVLMGAVGLGRWDFVVEWDEGVPV